MRITGLTFISLLFSSAPSIAAEFNTEACLKKAEAKFCNAASKYLPVITPDQIDFAALAMAGDLIESRSDQYSMAEEEFKKDKKGMNVKYIYLLAEVGLLTEAELQERRSHIYSLLIKKSKSNGWQAHQYCWDMLSVAKNAEGKKAVGVLSVISTLDMKGVQMDIELADRVAQLVTSPVPKEYVTPAFKHNEPNSGLCAYNKDGSLINEANGIVQNHDSSPDCPESPQFYQDRFREKRNVEDMVCLQKTLEEALY